MTPGAWAAGQHAAAVEEAAMQAVLKEQEADVASVLASQRWDLSVPPFAEALVRELSLAP